MSEPMDEDEKHRKEMSYQEHNELIHKAKKTICTGNK